MKAQAKFGGTKPKDKATKVKQAGYDIGTKGSPNIKSGGGVNTGQAANNHTAPRHNLSVPHGSLKAQVKVKQVGTTSGSGGHNQQQFRDSTLETRSAVGRPSLPGKEDNRTSWK